MESTTANPGVDRLSPLPDAILHSILSLLPLSEAAASTILSRRWRRLFPSIPDLTFDLSIRDEIHQGDIPAFPEEWFDILSSRDAPICKCFISYILQEYYAGMLDRLAFGLRALGISDLTLVGDLDTKHAVSPVIFSFENLRRFCVSFCRLEPPLEITGLSLLRELLLTRVDLGDDDLQRLVSHCPCLESLQLIYCCYLSRIVICSNSLSVLEVRHSGQITISVEKAPSLLRARIAIEDSYTMYGYGNLIGSDSDSDSEGEEEEEEEEEVVVVASKEGCAVHRFLKLLEGLSQVESLRLSFQNEVVRYMRKGVVPLPKKLPHQLQNLKKVYLKMPFSGGYLFSVLSCLLKSSLNVEELDINEHFKHRRNTGIAKAEYWDQFKPLECVANWPAYVALHVRFDELEHWIGFIRLLVMNARTIKKMSIACSGLPEEESEATSAFERARRDLLLLKRASPHVVLELTTSHEVSWERINQNFQWEKNMDW